MEHTNSELSDLEGGQRQYSQVRQNTGKFTLHRMGGKDMFNKKQRKYGAGEVLVAVVGVAGLVLFADALKVFG